ncbi:MAG: ATP-binding cassette domain-containing protein [Clostridiales Family XIII bacterium]|jgi:molybdate transport system ATP-binding protein|nr:ATP-binding cassette domain-containing protein [Clostridiales Family XIII bacterium]
MSLYVDIRKKYKNFQLDVAFETQPGETLALLGASGSGKSMTLKCIAGLVSPDEGVIRVNGRTLFDSSARIDLVPQARNVGYLFQNYALFPNMTVWQNIAIAWRPPAGAGRLKRRDALAMRAAAVDALLARYELSALAGQYPVQLSGGQQQRAALARIYAYEPEALLLDEPFSALDTFLRENMQAELKRNIRGYPGDVVLVTHSRDEAYKIAGRLVILDEGIPVAEGPTKEIFEDPKAAQAARITGCKNISPIRKTGPSTCFAEDWGIELDAGREVLEGHRYAGIRAHDFVPEEGPNSFEIEIDDVVEGPFEKNVILRAKGQGGPGCRLWWIVDRGASVENVTLLSVRPESILLLR